MNPLLLPELLRLVLQNLNDQGEKFQLTQCAQVNKLWADEATALLWACLSGNRRFRDLMQHITLARGPYYASKVRSVLLEEKDFDFLDGKGLAATLHWPMLASLWSRSASSYNLDDFIPQFFGTMLQRMSLNGGVCSDNVLYPLPARCPHLQLISLSSLPDITTQGFLTVLKALASIKRISLSQMEQLITTQVLKYLANREGLTGLHLLSRIRSWPIANSTWGSSSPFPQLDFAGFETEAAGFTGLFPHLSKVHFLTIKCLDSTDNLLLHAAHCSKLEYLDITFAANSWISGSDLVNLAERCRRLTEIELSTEKGSDIKTNDLNDAHMERVASLLPNLRKFEIEIDSENTTVSIQSFKSFGKHCRNMEDFSLNRDFLLEAISQEGICLFPTLWSLGVGKTTRYIDASRAEILNVLEPVLKYHLPSLFIISAAEDLRDFIVQDDEA